MMSLHSNKTLTKTHLNKSIIWDELMVPQFPYREFWFWCTISYIKSSVRCRNRIIYSRQLCCQYIDVLYTLCRVVWVQYSLTAPMQNTIDSKTVKWIMYSKEWLIQCALRVACRALCMLYVISHREKWWMHDGNYDCYKMCYMSTIQDIVSSINWYHCVLYSGILWFP
jgi:hypothetical protein